MEKFSANKRFIAGAVCPRCSAMDTIVVDRESDQRECVACGFNEARPGDPLAAPGELPTRVSKPAARRVETPAAVVTILEPGDNGAGRHPDTRPGKKPAPGEK